MSPPAKPAPRMMKVVPTPAKKMRAFDAMTATPVMRKNAEICTYVPVREKRVMALLAPCLIGIIDAHLLGPCRLRCSARLTQGESPVDSKRTQSEQAASRRRFPTGVRGGENASIHHVGDSNRDRRWGHRLLFDSSGSLTRRCEGTLAPIHSPAPRFSFWAGNKWQGPAFSVPCLSELPRGTQDTVRPQRASPQGAGAASRWSFRSRALACVCALGRLFELPGLLRANQSDSGACDGS
jgi:hypothetical protein